MEKAKIVASIEARMTSSRLPGKVLMNAINDKSMLEFMIERVKLCKEIDDIVVATTVNKLDDPIVDLCKELKVKYYRGSEPDVLDRVLQSHIDVNSDVIVELTGDCPLIDPEIMDQIIRTYQQNKFDYVSNAHIRSFPDGMDVQVFSVNVLKEVDKKATSIDDRENVSSYIYKSGEYTLKEVVAQKDLFWPELRITLDDVGDYELIKNIIHELYPKFGMDFTLKQILDYIRANPQLLDLNKDARVVEVNYQKKANIE